LKKTKFLGLPKPFLRYLQGKVRISEKLIVNLIFEKARVTHIHGPNDVGFFDTLIGEYEVINCSTMEDSLEIH
jgi:hypothetical protein